MRSSGNWAHFRLRSSGAPFTQVTFIRSETDLGTSKAHVTRNVVRHNWQSEREPTTASKPRGVCAIKDYVLIWQYHVIREKVLDGPTVKTSVYVPPTLQDTYVTSDDARQLTPKS
ncbi:hypothetical protein M404DRAFT_587135 [Pisolithus tinctorius Marx 270]|uniref:Uncharacterized protein n=1 Tax=Pisolithus tinctorius Marx 270 TaxID=870435 RepID=A0A0C3JWT9_PISTI|nr:hypothetical protein M404DRAFT_587135 [Pisolithus tinctorius Marx 270]